MARFLVTRDNAGSDTRYSLWPIGSMLVRSWGGWEPVFGGMTVMRNLSVARIQPSNWPPDWPQLQLSNGPVEPVEVEVTMKLMEKEAKRGSM